MRLLEIPPLPQWGRISYGVYLWYWPVLLVMSGQRLHWGVYPLFLARVADLGYDPTPLVQEVMRAFFLTTVRWGAFHGDVHAGNMMLLRDGRIVHDSDHR